MKLDYSIDSLEERKKAVDQYLAETPDPTPRALEILADYLIMCMEKQERREKKILTENRLVTVNKRETSFEGLAESFENGEDGIYNIMTENKDAVFRPKNPITQADLDEIPELRAVREAIEFWQQQQPHVSGHDAYVVKQTIIDFQKDQYIVRDSIKRPVQLKIMTHTMPKTYLDDEETLEDGKLKVSGVSLCDPNVCSAILCNYSKLVQAGYGVFDNDTWYLMEDFDRISAAALQDFPLLERIVELKIDGLSNADIQQKLQEEFGLQYTVEYLSTLWRKKIPAMIAEAAQDEFYYWYYLNKEPGQYKRCSRCGKLKLAIPRYFSKNNTSKDGYYSICKKCRAEKYKGKTI